MTSALLRTENLTVAFGGVLAVNGVDFDLQSGEIRALIGPNGAGKTTFFNTVTGLYSPTTGRISFNGTDITGWTPRAIARLGLVRTFQITSVFQALSVYENIWVAVQSNRSLAATTFNPGRRRQARQEAEAHMERMGLGRERNTAAANLSYGDQRVLEVALSLAKRPKLLLLDEPTAGMSPAETGRTVDLVREISAEVGIVVVEHDMDVIMDLADFISVFDRGRLIAEGSPAEIQANETVQQIYLGTAA